MVFYAVVRGHEPGIYTKLEEYQNQIERYPKCLHMKFPTREEAEYFLNRSKDGVVDKRPSNRSTSVHGSSSEQYTNNTNNFQFDEHGNVTVYTANFCPRKREPPVAGFGVFFGPESPLNFAGRVTGKATQHTASIQAMTHVLKKVARAGFDRVVVYTSSQYVIDCMTHYVAEWKKQGWIQGEAEKERPNKEDLLALDSASEGMMVTYRHINKHIDAKELAKMGCPSE